MKKILLVEDNEANIYLMEFLLSKNGFDVTVAKTAKEGINYALTGSFDLILMDIQLPDMDGLEAVREIRKSEKGHKIPIVAVTSYAMTGDREKTFSAGCSGYIEKPINPETFVREIGKFIL